ncbi:ATPase, T2SS/T4P/T4SS family [Alicyclobacillus macrosporangiidus]|uniref:Pilus assembly protein CpaF n=1 Tax=Alicyclobacillus macrosporangiidus TaxID=392015 RepID=A0A1I7L1X8_9BACL|nr:ATPase, T2SS/T4P/T4SS family [Alicyclobacillus macrosporangiidus]SFV03677.1 pilus assembly protein CpaF [Alicyclobacillus macrosporangiidus]
MTTNKTIVDLTHAPDNFDAHAYVFEQQSTIRTYRSDHGFTKAVAALNEFLDKLFEQHGDSYRERQHQAIIGDPAARSFFRDRIQDFLRQHPEFRTVTYPNYYLDLTDALFQTCLGFGPMSVWFRQPTEAAQVNGTAILFHKGGRKVRQPFSFDSLDQVYRLIRSITLRDSLSHVSSVDTSAEVEMLDGTRVSIMVPPTVQEPIITFRQYTFKEFTFEHEAETGTIPTESVPWFNALARLMLNTIITGPVRTGKSTLLKVFYAAREPDLTVITLERDSFEIRLKQDFPERAAHVIAIRTTLEEMRTLFPSLLRMDAHYIIVPEVRSGELEMLLLSAERGGGYLGTYHSPHILDIPAEFATLSLNDYPTRSYYAEYVRAAKTLDVVVSMTELDNGRKVVTGVYGFDFNSETGELTMIPWMEYDKSNGQWAFLDRLTPAIEQRMKRNDPLAYRDFKTELTRLAHTYPSSASVTRKSLAREER